MGWWGHESDANDDTRIVRTDGLSFGEGSDAYANSLQKLGQAIDIPDADGYSPSHAAFLGTVRKALVNRFRVSQPYLERAKRYATKMLADDEHTGSFRDPEVRKNCLRDEIAMIDDAIGNGGVTKKGEGSPGLLAKIGKALETASPKRCQKKTEG